MATDVSGSTTAEYIFFGGKRIAMLPAGGSAQYYVEDFLGSSRVVTQSNGVVCYDADLTPFGGELPYTSSCAAANNYKFEGKERDTETGNDDFGARYYSWRFGRWLSADWSAVPVPVPYANLTNPQTINLYAMVADDPESFADLDGHDPQGNTTTNAVNTCGGRPCDGKNSDAGSVDKKADSEAQQQRAAKPHVVRIVGNGHGGKALKAQWHYMITHSKHARSILKTALKNGDLTVRAVDGDAYYNSRDNSINVDPKLHPRVQTADGPEPAPTTAILGHELGHAAGAEDNGPNKMNNVIENGNPIRRDLGLPDRTQYVPPGSTQF